MFTENESLPTDELISETYIPTISSLVSQTTAANKDCGVAITVMGGDTVELTILCLMHLRGVHFIVCRRGGCYATPVEIDHR